MKKIRSSRAKKDVNLKEICGTKIRWQFFNVPIYFLLAFLPTFPIIHIVVNLQENSFNFAELIDDITTVLMVFGAVIIPLIFLSLLNRYLFGSIVGVITDEGLYLEDGLVAWENIEKIDYNPQILTKYTISPIENFSYATIRIKTSKHPIEIMHFPLYAVRKIKKQHPEIKVGLSKSGRLMVCIFVLAPTVLSIIVPLLSE